MKSLFLLAFMFISALPTWAVESAAPELLQLEKSLATEQEARNKGGVSPEQYRIFLAEFRPKLTETLSQVPPSPENSAAHARILALMGEHEEAAAGLDRALEGHPGDPTLTLALGHLRLQSNDYAGALSAANEILKADPSNPDALALKHQSVGRTAPSKSGGPPMADTPAAAGSNANSQVVFTEPMRRKPIASDVPERALPTSAPDESQPAPRWPLAIPFGLGLIGYGFYRNQRTEPDEPIPPEVDRGGRTTWGANEPLAKPETVSPEKLAANRRNLKFAAIAGGAILGGVALAKLVPVVIAGAESFFLSVGATGGGLVPAYATGASGAAASALNPTAVAAGARALGVTAVVVAEAKVASDYYSHADSNATVGGQPERNHPHGRYEGSPKHSGAQRGGPRGKISPEPKDGQAALDNSVQAKPTSSSRVGVDVDNEQIVVLREHLPGRFHGYVNSWSELESFARNALIRAGKTTSRGRIIKP